MKALRVAALAPVVFLACVTYHASPDRAAQDAAVPSAPEPSAAPAPAPSAQPEAPALAPPPAVAAPSPPSLESRRYLGLDCVPRGQAEYVYAVYPNGPASRAGLQKGDYLVALDGHPAWPQGWRATHGHAIGESVAVVYLRGGSSQATQLTIGSAAQLVPLCQAGNTGACDQVAALQRTRPGEVAMWTASGAPVPTVTPDMLANLAQLCANRNSEACGTVGTVLENGLGVAPDPVRAQG
ncbi:MAG: PDZ domain-containing protein [Myxococcales bacterium]